MVGGGAYVCPSPCTVPPLPSMSGRGWTGRDWVVGEWPSGRGTHTRCHACPHGVVVDAGCVSETGRQRIETVCTMQVFWFNTGAAWRSWSRLPWDICPPERLR